MEDLLKVLIEIRDLLRKQQQQQQQQQLQQQAQEKLGFGPPPTPTTVFINRSHGGVWYRLENGTPVMIQEPSLTCCLQSVHFETVSRRDKETSKLHIRVIADRPYVLEAGGTTQFSRSFLAACAMFPAGALHNKIVTIQPVPGDDDSVLFCRLFVNGELVRAPEVPPVGDSDAWRVMARRALAAVNGQ
jgi:hypothetical protein